MSAILLQDEIVHYEVLGRGRPLVFLHGWVGSWRYWIPAMQAASFSFRAYAIDLWGFGDSARNTRGYSLDQQAGLVDQFLDCLGIGKIALVGHGLGAAAALLFASQHPQQVDRIMAVSLPASSQAVNPRLSTAAPVELGEWLLDHNPVSDAARLEIPKTDPRAVAASLASVQSIDVKRLLVNLSTPCLVVHGQNDLAVQGAPLDMYVTLPDHIHQVIFEQSGHFPMLDETSQFNRLLADFLALSSGVSPKQLQLKEEWKRRVR